MNKVFLPVLALFCGATLTYDDSRPNWEAYATYHFA